MAIAEDNVHSPSAGIENGSPPEHPTLRRAVIGGGALIPQEQQDAIRKAIDGARQKVAKRYGLDPAKIDVSELGWCERFEEGTSQDNCAYSILNTENFPLPDHVPSATSRGPLGPAALGGTRSR